MEIDGDDSLQRHLRFGIYHLLRSANDSSRVAIDAKGYAGEAYFGHYFWDMEIYLLPFYIYTHPEQAKKLVSFRHRTLEGARKMRAAMGMPAPAIRGRSVPPGRNSAPTGSMQILRSM